MVHTVGLGTHTQCQWVLYKRHKANRRVYINPVAANLALVCSVWKWTCHFADLTREDVWALQEDAREGVGSKGNQQVSSQGHHFPRWWSDLCYVLDVFMLFYSFNPHSNSIRQIGTKKSPFHWWGNWGLSFWTQVGLLSKGHDLNCKLTCPSSVRISALPPAVETMWLLLLRNLARSDSLMFAMLVLSFSREMLSSGRKR